MPRRSYYFFGGPFGPQSRTEFKQALETRYDRDHEKCFNYVNGAADRFINKGLGLLTYDALLVTISTIGVDPTKGLSCAARAAVLVSLLSALLIMLWALRVEWPKNSETISNRESDFTYYVDEAAKRGIAVNVGLYLAMFATVCVLGRVFFQL